MATCQFPNRPATHGESFRCANGLNICTTCGEVINPPRHSSFSDEQRREIARIAHDEAQMVIKREKAYNEAFPRGAVIPYDPRRDDDHKRLANVLAAMKGWKP